MPAWLSTPCRRCPSSPPWRQQRPPWRHSRTSARASWSRCAPTACLVAFGGSACTRAGVGARAGGPSTGQCSVLNLSARGVFLTTIPVRLPRRPPACRCRCRTTSSRGALSHVTALSACARPACWPAGLHLATDRRASEQGRSQRHALALPKPLLLEPYLFRCRAYRSARAGAGLLMPCAVVLLLPHPRAAPLPLISALPLHDPVHSTFFMLKGPPCVSCNTRDLAEGWRGHNATRCTGGLAGTRGWRARPAGAGDVWVAVLCSAGC